MTIISGPADDRNITVRVVSSKMSRFRRATQYRFKIYASNGRLLAVSSETYTNKADAARAASLVVGAEVGPN